MSCQIFNIRISAIWSQIWSKYSMVLVFPLPLYSTFKLIKKLTYVRNIFSIYKTNALSTRNKCSENVVLYGYHVQTVYRIILKKFLKKVLKIVGINKLLNFDLFIIIIPTSKALKYFTWIMKHPYECNKFHYRIQCIKILWMEHF